MTKFIKIIYQVVKISPIVKITKMTVIIKIININSKEINLMKTPHSILIALKRCKIINNRIGEIHRFLKK